MSQQRDIALASQAPKFLVATKSDRPLVEVAPKDNAMLRKVVSLQLVKPTIGSLLTEIEQQTHIRFGFSRDALPVDRPVTLSAERITVGAALLSILMNTGMDVVISSDGKMAIQSRHEPSIQATGNVIGQVRDSAMGKGLGLVEVFLEHTHWRTMTDSSGRFYLANVEVGEYTLTARRLGYKKQSHPATVSEGQTDTVDIVLGPLATRLTDLVSTATGRQRRIDVSNDVTTIEADSVMQVAPIRSVTDLLETRVPGLTVQHTSGAPGDPSRLRLRGSGSILRNNDPIIFIDGVRVYSEQSASRSSNLAVDWGINDGDSASGGGHYATPSPLDYIDPNSIETIEVLKGPSASTLYGPDAANGVIVITTKKGKTGPALWSASAEYGLTKISGEFPDLMLRWGHRPRNGQSMLCQIGDLSCIEDSLFRFQLLNDPALTVLDQGRRSSVSLGVSGGNNVLTYAMTGSYQNEIGLPKLPVYEVNRYKASLATSPPDWMQRPQYKTQWGIVSNIGVKLGNALDLNFTTNLSRIIQQRSSLDKEINNLLGTFVDTASGLSYTASLTGVGIFTFPTSDGVLKSYFQRVKDSPTQLTGGLALQWRPRSWFRVDANAGIDMIYRADEIYEPSGLQDILGNSTDDGRLNVGQGRSVVSTMNLRGNTTVPLGLGFQFRFDMGANYIQRTTDDQTLLTSMLPIGTSLQGSVINGGRRRSEADAIFGWYLQPSIGNSKFNFSSGLRLDSGRNFGGRISAPTFPKLGFSYLVSDESWFPFKNVIESMRLRLSYGRASRQPGVTHRLRSYGSSESVVINGEYVDGVFLESLGNTELRPERSSEIEGGFDLDAWDNRVTLVVTGYRKTTDDALLGQSLPPSIYGSGASIWRNIGQVQNTGLELTVGTQIIRSNRFIWTTSLAVTKNRNVVTKLGTGAEPFYLNSNQRVAQGYPLYGRWSRPILGYADANGDGVLEKEEILVGDTAVYVGGVEPNYMANFNTRFDLWRSVSLNASFAYQNGLAQLNALRKRLIPFSRGLNDSTASLSVQAASTFLPETDYNLIQVVDILRFHTLGITYRAPVGLVRWLGAQAITLSLQGANLGLWSNYHGLDPNVNSASTGNEVADTGIIPIPRTWQVRVNVKY